MKDSKFAVLDVVFDIATSVADRIVAFFPQRRADAVIPMQPLEITKPMEHPKESEGTDISSDDSDIELDIESDIEVEKENQGTSPEASSDWIEYLKEERRAQSSKQGQEKR